MKKIFSCLYFLFYIIQLSAQTDTLSKNQMYSDYDQLIKIFQECNPQIQIRRKVTNIDQLNILQLFRVNIDTISSTSSFYNLLNKTLYFMYDEHITIATEIFESDILKGIDTSAIGKQKNKIENFFLENNLQNDPYSPFCNPMYINGDYYMIGCFRFTKSDNSSQILICNPKLVYYNDVLYSDYIVKNSPFGLRWDNRLKKHFATKSSFPYRGTITVLYKNELIKINLDEYTGVDIIVDPNFKISDNIEKRERKKNINSVEYITEEKVLFIRLVRMIDDQRSFANTVKDVGKNKEISKIIIDVRNNNGGNDLAWKYIVEAIISDSIKDFAVTAVLNTSKIKELYLNSTKINNINYWKIKKFRFLPNCQFLYSETTPTYFIPDSNSLRFEGNIYVIQNEQTCSSAQSFCSFTKSVDQFRSVGVPTGMIGGRVLTPELFQLNYSKFSFRMGTTLEITNIKTPYDFYNDYPEIYIEIPFFNQLQRYNDSKIYNIFSIQYLLNQDYTFKKILEFE
jgi:hypothetical protein